MRSGKTSAFLHGAIISLVLWALVPAAAGAAEAASDGDESWYALMLGEQRAGWVCHRVWSDEQEQLHSLIDLQIQIRRGTLTVAMQMQETFIETAAGEPVSAEARQRFAQEEVVQRLSFSDAGIELEVHQSGQVQKRTLPPPARDWLPPVAAQRYTAERIAAGDERISYHTMEPTGGGTLMEITLERQEPTPVEVLGKTVPATRWRQTSSATPGMPVDVYLADDATVLRTVIPLPAMPIEMLLADEQLARSPLNPPELVASTLIEPAGRINQPRRLRRAVYTLSLPDRIEDVAAPPLPTAAAQRVEVEAGDRPAWRVTVDLDEPVEADANPNDRPTEAHRSASMMLSSDDVEVRKLVAQALAGGGANDSAPDRAERLRRFVSEFIQAKDLSVGLATASEVARTRQGDCTEHAVLLAAMLRAADIPSRTVSGLIYVEGFLGRQNVFGYHMWTQVWIDDAAGGGRWVDLDATLDGQAFDAAHIALNVSAMSDGELTNDMVALMPLLGRLSIQIVEPAEAGGK